MGVAQIRKGRRPKTFPRKRKDDDDQTRRQAAYENRKKKDRQIKEFAESGIGAALGLAGVFVMRNVSVWWFLFPGNHLAWNPSA